MNGKLLHSVHRGHRGAHDNGSWNDSNCHTLCVIFSGSLRLIPLNHQQFDPRR
jgi:hypothetical protein